MLISVGTLWRKELLSEVTHAKSYHESGKKDLIAHLLLTPPRQGGNKLLLVVERGEKIVPSLNSAFPKPKEEAVEKPKSYSQEVPALQRSDVDPFFWSKLFSQIFNSHLCSGPREDRKASRPEGAGFHHGEHWICIFFESVFLCLLRWGRPRWPASSTTPPWPCTARTSSRRS